MLDLFVYIDCQGFIAANFTCVQFHFYHHIGKFSICCRISKKNARKPQDSNLHRFVFFLTLQHQPTFFDGDDMEISWNGGTPKSSILIRFPINWGSISGNLHIIKAAFLVGCPQFDIPMNPGDAETSWRPSLTPQWTRNLQPNHGEKSGTGHEQVVRYMGTSPTN